MVKLKFSYPPSHDDLLRKSQNSSEQSHRHPSDSTNSSTLARDELVIALPPCPLAAVYAEEEEVSVYAEEEEEEEEEEEAEALNDEKKKDKRKKKKGKESRRLSSKSSRSASKDRRDGKTGHTSESNGESRQHYERWIELKNPERRRQLRERSTVKSVASDSPLPPADMVWRDRRSSRKSHSHAFAMTDSPTFVRAELAVVPPAPVTDAIYPLVEFGAYGKVEVLCDKEKRDKKNKETKHSASERQSPRGENKGRHHGKDGNTLDAMGERTERHERRKHDEKDPELRWERKERRESKKSSTSSHRRSVRNSQAGDEKDLDGHALCTPPTEQPKRATKPTEQDCDRLLKQLLHAQQEMLKAVTGENVDAPPASHPLILTWDQDFQEVFDAFAGDTTENFDKSFGEISHEYFLSKDQRD